MTLKEKFKNILIDWIDEYYDREHIAEVIEIDADDYAIEFAEWYLNLSKSDDWEKFDNNTNKQLLEIFKIEKRL